MSSVPARPFVDLSVDVLTLSPADEEGHDAAVVMVDNFSGWCELVPTKSVTSEIIVRYLVQYFGRYGAPVVVRSDQDSTFVSKLVDGFYAATGIQPNRTIPHHPESNGIVERCNREVLQLASAMTLDERVPLDTLSGWCDVLPFVQRIINSSVTRKTGCANSLNPVSVAQAAHCACGIEWTRSIAGLAQAHNHVPLSAQYEPIMLNVAIAVMTPSRRYVTTPSSCDNDQSHCDNR